MNITINNLNFGYPGGKQIFNNVSFNFDTDWKIGLISRNGRGKTTFLKILCGELEYTGNITKNVSFEYFPPAITDKTKCAIDIVLGLDPMPDLWDIIQNMQSLYMDENSLYVPFETLSYGEQFKLLLAVLFSKPNNFLLIDEPTNHIDDNSKSQIKDFLKVKTGYIIVSHDRDFLDSTVDHIISINKTTIDVERGNFSSWWQNKEYKDNFEISENEKLNKEIKSLNKSIMDTAAWSQSAESHKGDRISGVKADKGFMSHKASKIMARSKAIEKRKLKMVDEKESLLKDVERVDDLFLIPLNNIKGNFIELKEVSLFYGDKQVAKDINFSINQGDKVCLAGKNGSGKSSVIKLIMGENITFTGKIYKNSRIKIAYCPQYFEYTGTIDDYIQETSADKKIMYTLLSILGFNFDNLKSNINDLSEGEKRKVILSKTLSCNADLYVFDEPLNYIDAISRMQIEKLLSASDATMLFVDHDKKFCNSVQTKTVILS